MSSPKFSPCRKLLTGVKSGPHAVWNPTSCSMPLHLLYIDMGKVIMRGTQYFEACKRTCKLRIITSTSGAARLTVGVWPPSVLKVALVNSSKTSMTSACLSAVLLLSCASLDICQWYCQTFLHLSM